MANVAQELSRSIWMELGPAIAAPTLESDLACDIVIVGAGIAGLSCAYELVRFGYSVAVIDRGQIGQGMTARTTAHLASALDDFYSALTRLHGEETAGRYHESQVAAINRIEAVCEKEGIDADFARVDGFLVPASSDHQSDLEKEFDACVALGVEVEWTDKPPVPANIPGRSIRFTRQARMHPLKYLSGLARCVVNSGGKLFGNTAYVSHEKRGDKVLLRTETGQTLEAFHAIFATNSPVNDKVALHTKEMPFRTYALAGKVPKGSVPDVLLWDTLEHYHYVRIQPADEERDYLIVGGEDHRSGQETDMEQRLQAIEAWARARYPSLGNVEYRWSGQVLEPIDFMPFTGRNPGDNNIYVHTGDSGQGITNGVLASLIIPPLICGQKVHFADIVDPTRKPLGLTSLKEFVVGQAGAALHLAEHVGPSEVSSIAEIRPGNGSILRHGSLQKLAVYKDEKGKVYACSASCTHVGCVVHWNPFEKCWDCPCHGSQFAPDGQVLNGPAVKALSREKLD